MSLLSPNGRQGYLTDIFRRAVARMWPMQQDRIPMSGSRQGASLSQPNGKARSDRIRCGTRYNGPIILTCSTAACLPLERPYKPSPSRRFIILPSIFLISLKPLPPSCPFPDRQSPPHSGRFTFSRFSSNAPTYRSIRPL